MTLTSRERVRRAMATGAPGGAPGAGESLPDRVPVFCQLALGHYFLNAGLSPFDVWYRSEGFAAALLALARRYRFDGILVAVRKGRVALVLLLLCTHGSSP